MKIGYLFVFLFLCSGGHFVFAKEIDQKHLQCRADSDCAVVTVGCGCIHNSTCAGPDDLQNGFVVGVNRKFSERYADLSKCSAKETSQCAVMGACPSRGDWTPKCIERKCTVGFKPRD